MAETDVYSSHKPGLTTPGRKAFAITPHDTNELANTTRAIWVGTGGTVSVVLEDDSTQVNLTNVPNGTLLPLRAKIVHTDSTATGMIGIY
jgi:hypothetical protein